MSAEEWADINVRAPEEYRQILRLVDSSGWDVHRVLVPDARAETLKVQVFGPNNYIGQAVFRARSRGGQMGPFELGECVVGRYRARPTTFHGLLATLADNRQASGSSAVRRAA